MLYEESGSGKQLRGTAGLSSRGAKKICKRVPGAEYTVKEYTKPSMRHWVAQKKGTEIRLVKDGKG